MSSERLHATTILVGEYAVLIRGPSGSGKSALALALMARPPLMPNGLAPMCIRLVADDQTLVEVAGGRLLARPHPALAGRIEMRGHGILKVPFEPVAEVKYVVERVEGDRLPGIYHDGVLIMGVRIQVLQIAPQDPDPVGRLMMGLSTSPISV